MSTNFEHGEQTRLRREVADGVAFPGRERPEESRIEEKNKRQERSTAKRMRGHREWRVGYLHALQLREMARRRGNEEGEDYDREEREQDHRQ